MEAQMNCLPAYPAYPDLSPRSSLVLYPSGRVCLLGVPALRDSMIQADSCRARDYDNRPREAHKPALCVYDERIVISCVWCGKMLRDYEAEISAHTAMRNKCGIKGS